ncbi:hypothetical protein PybrP1_001288 [[Pythium] brassicae (nom. inval.)]|nr:hypothetical protein PybrP1_001288 [[Pythium] brassicae (nom. inval.)]
MLDAHHCPDAGCSLLDGEGERDGGHQDRRQFSWWNYNVDEQTGARSYSNVEDAIEFVAKVCREQGPFDGVFGFSQGGMLASFVLQHQLKTQDPSPFAFSFGIFASAPQSVDPQFVNLSVKLSFPSLHIIGESDTVVAPERCMQLAETFVEPRVLLHPGGHYIPTNKDAKDALRALFQEIGAAKAARWTVQSASMHLGRATAAATKEFLQRGEGPSRAVARLRVGAAGSGDVLHVSRRGVGSPHFWAKDVPRINASKHAISSFQSNFLQAAVNPYVEASRKDAEKQTYVESLALQELIDDFAVPRESLIVSALLTDDIVQPAGGDALDRLSQEYIVKGVSLAAHELNVETLDHVVCRIPDALLSSSTLEGALQRACEALEGLRASNQLQSYGFAVAPSGRRAGAAPPLDALVESVFARLAGAFDHFASLQLPVGLSSGQLPLSRALAHFQDAHRMLLVADKPLEATLSNGKPLVLTGTLEHTGEDVALLLKSAFNLALSVERKYLEVVLPAHAQLRLPAAESVAWAHILANQHGQFDNLEEWVFIRETQIAPRFEVTLQELANFDETKELSFAYSVALRQLLKCFTASVELLDASRVQRILDAAMRLKLADASTKVEEVAVLAAASSGADVVLVQEQLGQTSALAFEAAYSAEQLTQLVEAAEPALQVT